MGDSPQTSNQVRSACTECQRRKQKCNREWPCNHCQKRKVADKCRFNNANQIITKKAAHDKCLKRQLDHDEDSESNGSLGDEVDRDGIDALGYMPSHVLYDLTAQDEVVRYSSREYIRDARSCPPLERALQCIPSRPYTDTLVQNFLNNINYHYYIIYPSSFLEQYQKWWTDRAEGKPLCIQWTCLLLIVCACASQYTDLELQKKLEVDLREPIQRLTEQYHEAARELGSTIPLDYSHLINVQHLLHSCYWFKSEARFVECWHVLNSAIREAQELGMHKESPGIPVSEFELEIRRRVWCVLDTWDWQISALLGRPMIIDRADCNVGLPSLTLEGKQHHPLIHMKLQSALIQKLYNRFGLTKHVTAPADVQEYQEIVEGWITEFPPPFDVHNPDKSLDESCPWIVLHRHYIRTMAFSMLLNPIRLYLARPFTIDATDAECKIRSDGINYCLELMVSLRGFFNHVYPRNSKFHFVLFCIFDTSTVLCSAVFHDAHNNLPRRDDVHEAIDNAHAMLQRLSTVTKSAKASYRILTRISQRLPHTNALRNVSEVSQAKRVRTTERPFEVKVEVAVPKTAVSETILPETAHSGYTPPQVISPPSTLWPTPPANPEYGATPRSYGSNGVSPPAPSAPLAIGAVATDPMSSNGFIGPSYVDWESQISPQQQQDAEVSFSNVSAEDLTTLALWNYQSLDFNFDRPNNM